MLIKLLVLLVLLAAGAYSQTPVVGGEGGSFSSGDADADIQALTPLKCTDAGVNDTYTCTMSPVPASAAAAPLLWFDPNTSNTGAATLDIGPGSALPIYQNIDGNNPEDEDLRADTPILLQYCGACNSAAGAWLYRGKDDIADNVTYSVAAAANAVAVYDELGKLPIEGMPTDLFIAKECFNILDAPEVGDQIPVAMAAAGTITRVQSGTTSGTVTFNVEERSTRAGAGVDVMTAELVADGTDQTHCASGCDVTTAFANAAFDANDWLVLTVSAVSSPVGFGACVVYEFN